MPHFKLTTLICGLFLTHISLAKANELIPDWMSYDIEKKQVSYQLIAAKNANNNGYNYNGYYQGNITLIVPSEWLVNISLNNGDANAVHDIILTEPFADDDMPDELTGEFAALKRAYISPLYANETDSLKFIAKQGAYWLFCGVKVHGINGMWIKLTVQDNIHKPSIKINSALIN
ncbi:MAG: hypothetical protein GQ582_07000 [Methyloprofundus sp.]|nr:hypothetical protein [Methyloprofundus sp.]